MKPVDPLLLSYTRLKDDLLNKQNPTDNPSRIILYSLGSQIMSDKRTGKKKKKIRPVVVEETASSASKAPVIPQKKTQKTSKR